MAIVIHLINFLVKYEDVFKSQYYSHVMGAVMAHWNCASAKSAAATRVPCTE